MEQLFKDLRLILVIYLSGKIPPSSLLARTESKKEELLITLLTAHPVPSKMRWC